MQFIQIFGGDLKEGKTREFVKWLNANEQPFADAHPDGAKYIGTFFAVRTSEKKAGNVYTLVEMDSYGTQDAMAGAGGEYHRLLDEAISFFDQRNDANYSSILLKSATEATIYGD